MTIRWICEKCGKVVAYVDPQVQVQEAIDNPEQFCECPEENPEQFCECPEEGGQ